MRIHSFYPIVWGMLLAFSITADKIYKGDFSILGAMLLGTWTLIIIKFLHYMVSFINPEFFDSIKLPPLRCPIFKIFTKRIEISIRLVNKDNSKITF